MRNECGLLISKNEIASRFSVDEKAQKFSGALLLDISKNSCTESTAKTKPLAISLLN